MIFQHTWQQVLDGTKTQTRRIMNRREFPLVDVGNFVDCVTDASGRVKWQLGKTYAVQQGRGKPSIARIEITKIRYEQIQDMDEEDSLAEGVKKQSEVLSWGKKFTWYSFSDLTGDTAKAVYRDIWNSIHTKTGETWADNPLVWVLEFELVRGRE